jgi:hypothetical protein
MSKRVTIIGVPLLFSISVAPAQTPSSDAMSAAPRQPQRKLVDMLKLSDQFKGQLRVILLSIKPAVVQGRPEIECDYDAMTPTIADPLRPSSMPWSTPLPRPMPTILPWTSCAKSRRSIVALPGKSFCKSCKQSPSRVSG